MENSYTNSRLVNTEPVSTGSSFFKTNCMKKIFFTLLLIGMAGLGIGQQVKDSLPQNSPGGVPGPAAASPGIRLRCGMTPVDTRPLYIVDGNIWDGVGGLDPNDIESVSVLKPPSTLALYGSRGVNGVILVTTKSLWITIRDSVNGSTIPFATIEVRSDERVFTVRSDAEGKARLQGIWPRGDYRITVSSMGYRKAAFHPDTSRNKNLLTVYLARDIRTCSEVVVMARQATRISCGFMCVTGFFKCDQHTKEKKPINERPSISLFPNPATRGSIISIAFDSESAGELFIEMADMQGRRLLQRNYRPVKGKNIVSMPVDKTWTAGIYFIKVSSNAGDYSSAARVLID